MAKFIVHGNPFTKESHEVEADRFAEDGSYTKFYKGDEIVHAVPTQNVTKIETK